MQTVFNWLSSDAAYSLALMLLDVAVKSTVVLVTATIVALLLRSASAAVRHRVWSLSLIALLVLPVLSGFLPAWRFPILPATAPSVDTRIEQPVSNPPIVDSHPLVEVALTPVSDPPQFADPNDDPFARSPGNLDADRVVFDNREGEFTPNSPIDDVPVAVETVASVDDEVSPTPVEPNTVAPTPRVAWLLPIWAVGAIFVLIPLAIGYLRNWRLCATSQRLSSGTWINLCNALSRQLAIRRRVTLMETTRPLVPLTSGVLRPVILLSQQSAAWPETLGRSVLLHELAHVKRYDVAHQIVGRLVCALYWFQPLAWYALRQLRVERELACDDCVVLSGETPSDYAQQLVEIARTFQPLRLHTAVAMACRSDLEHRVRSLFDRTCSHMPLSSTTARILLLAALIFVPLLAVIRPAPQAVSQEIAVSDEAETNEAPPSEDEATTTDPARVKDEEQLNTSTPEPPTATPTTDGTRDPRLEEIIQAVKENEAKYRNLDVKLRNERWLVSQVKPKGLTGTRTVKEQQIVWQGDLFHFQEQETEARTSGEEVKLTRASAFDGEKTITIDYGNSANIHHERHESQHIYPPHTWALLASRVNFPLSTLLQGTDAIKQHPKAHVYFSNISNGGMVDEFLKVNADSFRVEVDYLGIEPVGDLSCIKLRVRRQFTSGFSEFILIWLAPERNYLCAKSEVRPEVRGGSAKIISHVDEFREIAPGLWLPAKLSIHENEEAWPPQDQQNIEWKTTLTLTDARPDPNHRQTFFRDLAIPVDLPTFDLKDGRLVGTTLRSHDPTADSAKRVQQILSHVRVNDEKYKHLQVRLETEYRRLNSPSTGIPPNEHDLLSSTHIQTQEQTIQSGDRLSFSEQKKATTIDGATVNTENSMVFDGAWARFYKVRIETKKDQTPPKQEESAELKWGTGILIPAHRPHVIPFHLLNEYSPLSGFISPFWDLQHNEYPFRIDFVGEEKKHGLDCVIIRDALEPAGPGQFQSYRLLWLAKERNYLPIYTEAYTPDQSVTLPRATVTATDLRELAPGVWFPFSFTTYAFDARGETGIETDRQRLIYEKRVAVQEATLTPQVTPEDFAGPNLPLGTTVLFADNRNRAFGSFTQETAGPAAISSERYAEILEAAVEKNEQFDRELREDRRKFEERFRKLRQQAKEDRRRLQQGDNQNENPAEAHAVPAATGVVAPKSISGLVLTPDGKPVANASLWRPSPSGWVRFGNSDEGGRFELAEITPEFYADGEETFRIRATALGYDIAGFEVKKGTTNEIVLRLPEETPIVAQPDAAESAEGGDTAETRQADDARRKRLVSVLRFRPDTAGKMNEAYIGELIKRPKWTQSIAFAAWQENIIMKLDGVMMGAWRDSFTRDANYVAETNHDDYLLYMERSVDRQTSMRLHGPKIVQLGLLTETQWAYIMYVEYHRGDLYGALHHNLMQDELNLTEAQFAERDILDRWVVREGTMLNHWSVRDHTYSKMVKEERTRIDEQANLYAQEILTPAQTARWNELKAKKPKPEIPGDIPDLEQKKRDVADEHLRRFAFLKANQEMLGLTDRQMQQIADLEDVLRTGIAFIRHQERDVDDGDEAERRIQELIRHAEAVALRGILGQEQESRVRKGLNLGPY